MAGIILPSRFTSQPQCAVQIDWSNPLTKGLAFARIGNSPQDVVTGRMPVAGTGTPGIEVGRFGRARTYNNTSDYYAGLTAIDESAQFGLLLLVDITSNGSYSALISHTPDLGAGNGWGGFVHGGQTRLVSGTDAAYDVGIADSDLEGVGPVLIGGGYDGASYVGYLHGQQTGSASAPTDPPGLGNGYLKVGASHDTDQVVGNYYLVLVWTRLPSAAEYAALQINPWQVFKAADGDLLLSVSAAGSTGTLATTNANDTSAASGTTTVRGSLARTNANDTSAASGSTTVQGTLARTNANDTSAASGSPIVNGALATTNANDTVVASGSVGGAVTGTLATTNANDTSSAAGTTAVVGSLARTNANDTSAASGTTTVLGTLARTNANDTSAGAGTTTVTGSLANTNANDTLAASGVAGSPVGTVAYTNNNDTSAAQGVSVGGQSGAPGGRPVGRSAPWKKETYVVYIDGKQYVGDFAYIQALLLAVAEKQAEKTVEGTKPSKKPRIVVEPGKSVPKESRVSEPAALQVQKEAREFYETAYQQALKQLEEDEEETLAMLL